MKLDEVAETQEAGMIEVPELPFKLDALEPHMTKETLEYHYGKHHKGYVKNLNKLIKGTRFEDNGLEKIVRDATGTIFNNAAQVWNHSFFWDCLTPEETEPSDELKEALEKKFKSVDGFKEEFEKQLTKLFGSGWCWLVRTAGGVLDVRQYKDAKTPLTEAGVTPLFVVDVWEHAYYLQHQNDRKSYLSAVWNIANWDFVNKNFSEAKS